MSYGDRRTKEFWSDFFHYYVTHDVTLRSLSREHTGNPEDPPYLQIARRSSKYKWRDKKEEIRRQALDSVKGIKSRDEPVTITVGNTVLPVPDETYALRRSPPPSYADNFATPDRRFKYNNISSDPELLSQQQEIALVKLRIDETHRALEQHLDAGPDVWRSLNKLKAKIKRSQSAAEQSAALNEMFALLDMKAQESSLESHLIYLMQRKSELTMTEIKRQSAMQKHVADLLLTRFSGAIAQMCDSIRKHVHDPEVAAALCADMRAIGNNDKALTA